MSDKDTALHKLKIMEKILSDHSDVFAAWEGFELGTALKYLLVYIDNKPEGSTTYSG